MEVRSRYNETELRRILAENTTAISTCFGFAIATTFGENSQLVGDVSHTRIVLARARPFLNSISKPVFTGTVIRKANDVILTGSFEVNCFRKYVFWASSLVFAAAELLILVSIFAPENGPIVSARNIIAASVLPAVQLIAYIFTKLTKDRLFIEDETWIKQELTRLLA
jgi:hypothetical protein